MLCLWVKKVIARSGKGWSWQPRRKCYFIFPEQGKNHRIQIFSDEFGKILFTNYTSMIKEYIVFGWHDQQVVERREKVVKNQNNLRHLTGLAKLEIRNFRKKEVRRDRSGGVRERHWWTGTTEPHLLVVNTEKRLLGPIRMKGCCLLFGDSHRSRRNRVRQEAFSTDQSEWITKRSGQVRHAYLRKRKKIE